MSVACRTFVGRETRVPRGPGGNKGKLCFRTMRRRSVYAACPPHPAATALHAQPDALHTQPENTLQDRRTT